MRKLFRIAGSLAVVVAAGLLTAWWWYLFDDIVAGAAMPGDLVRGTLNHDGIERRWLVYLPTTLADRPSIVLVLHGSRGDGDRIRRLTSHAFDQQAERHGFIAVYPDGFEQHWNDCRATASYSANARAIDDVGFLAALVDEMRARWGADPSRVFAAGLSNGGHMAYRLGLEAPERVRGIAAIAASLPVDANLDCARRGRPVPVMIVNGTDDPVNPYGGGLVDFLGDTSRGSVLSATDTAAYWAGLAGLTGASETLAMPDEVPGDGSTVSRTVWARDGAPSVVLVTVSGGGHTIPHPRSRLPRLLGRTNHDVDAAAMICDFFDRLSRAEISASVLNGQNGLATPRNATLAIPTQ